VRALTQGRFEIDAVEASPDGRALWFRANPHQPGVHEIHRLTLDDGTLEAVTALGGRTSGQLSPDGTKLLLVHSRSLSPPELYVQDATPGATARQLTHTTSDVFRAVDWARPEIVAVPSRHGTPIYTRVYRPDEPASTPRPVVAFVHGAGYLQNAHHGWSDYFREFMFHTLLVRAGYVVVDADYRASAGYGRDWRTAIYRGMGPPELDDYEDVLAWLDANADVDLTRVGVYGGSYGGFVTLMGLFQRPGLFACGAALRPVTDWAHYNHGYTSNILNEPELDPEAFKASSPIEFADGLDAPLLICHGLVDDNVLAKDSIRLAQRLIELEKEDWELALFPIEPHGFREPSSWLDEYRRIFKLFETHLKSPAAR
jgi:dipeptidyl aminopeptidase/acylaminoacyl peptidase